MIKFAMKTKDQGRLIGLGLSRKNVEKLQADQPIAVDLADLVAGSDIKIVIFFGETEEEMRQTLLKLGLELPENAGSEHPLPEGEYGQKV